jgi:hypothetical protein
MDAEVLDGTGRPGGGFFLDGHRLSCNAVSMKATMLLVLVFALGVLVGTQFGKKRDA